MSEVEAEALFGLASTEFESREIRQLFLDIREYEVLINQVSPSPEELDELVASLDSRWPYMNRTVVVSGNVIMPTYDDNPDAINHSAVYIEDKPAESLGFNTMLITDQDDNLRRIIGHALVFDPEPILEKPLLKKYAVKHGFACIDDVAMELPFETGAAYFDKIHYRFPELATELDTALLNSPDESAALMSLAGITMQIGPHELPESLRVISEYVNSLMDFDTKVPYQMEFEGRCYVIDPQTPEGILPAHAEHGITLAYPLRIETISTDESGTCLTFGVRIELVNEDRADDTGREYIIPITETLQITDVRSQIYSVINSPSDKPS